MKSEIYSSDATFAKIPNSSFYLNRYSTTEPINHLLHHYHDSYELYYLYSGERYYFIQDKTYHVTKGTFVLINPYEIHRTGKLASYGFHRMLIHFDRKLLTDFIPNINPYEILDKGIHIISLDTNEQIFAEELLKNMENLYNNNQINELIKLDLTKLLLFLNNCNKNILDKPIEHINTTQKTIFEIIGYINNNYNQDITLNDISNKYFLSTYYLSRVFKEITGFHFVEYLNNVRIKEAKKLLKNSNLTIDEIALKVGFMSNTHFGRVFKSITNQSPSQFKKNSTI